MSIVVLFYAVEGVLCNLFFSPTATTDMEIPALIIFFINVFLTAYAVAKSVKIKEDKYLILYFLIALAGRVMFLLWDIYAQDIFILPNAEGDAIGYAGVAISYAFGSRAKLFDYNRYTFYMGLFYRLFGIQKINAQFLNVFLSMCSIVMVYRILCNMGIGFKSKQKVIVTLCLLPNYMLISSVFLQESLITFFIVLSVYCYTNWWVKRRFAYFVLAIVASAIGALFHMGALSTAVGFVATYFFVNEKDHKLNINSSRLVSTVVAVIIGLSILTTFGGDLLGKTGGDLSAKSLTSYGALSDSGGSQYTIGIPGLPPTLDLILNSPIRVIYFVFAPLPWQWRGIGDIIAFFGSTIFYIYAVYVAIKTIKNAPKGSIKSGSQWSYFIVIIAILLIATLMFGWGVSSSGSALRHREKFTCVTAILIGLATHLGEKNEENINNNTDI